MPPLFILAAIGAGAYFGAKWVKRVGTVQKRPAANNRKTGSKAGHSKNKVKAENLKQDPVSGVYHVED